MKMLAELDLNLFDVASYAALVEASTEHYFRQG